MKTMSQVMRLCDCPETLEEAKGIIVEQGRALENARIYRLKLEHWLEQAEAAIESAKVLAEGFVDGAPDASAKSKAAAHFFQQCAEILGRERRILGGRKDLDPFSSANPDNAQHLDR